ncbi:hypothetical protein GALL_354830 [mine drainage metagenome]|uniref:Uncharacterized protein n=1 Tax=mine drainage metagenome TaxID=410659 RepID=A0A1J5QS71_9ZZZZ
MPALEQGRRVERVLYRMHRERRMLVRGVDDALEAQQVFSMVFA